MAGPWNRGRQVQPGSDAAPPRGFDARKARSLKKTTDALGLMDVRYDSNDGDLEQYYASLVAADEWIRWDYEREWMLHLLYERGQQDISYDNGSRTYLSRPRLAWQIRSTYNLLSEIQNLHVARLTENKPTVTLQSRTADRRDTEKAELKEQVFWYLWERLSIHRKIVDARRWAFACGSGFFKATWNPDAGQYRAATMKRPLMATIQIPQVDPNTGQYVMGPDGVAVMQSMEVEAGDEEYYIDKDGNDLGPVVETVTDPDGTVREVKRPVPSEAEWLAEGEAEVEALSAFNILYDRSANHLRESPWVIDRRLVTAPQIAQMGFDPEKLEKANQAVVTNWTLATTGFQPRWGFGPQGSSAWSQPAGSARPTETQAFNTYYQLAELWQFPTTPMQRKQWGEQGCILTFVGQTLVNKRPMPEWALRARPFVQLLAKREEGNHYGRPNARDLIPLQDDINRSRSMLAQRALLNSRSLLWAPQNHGLNLRAFSGFPATLVTTKSAEQKPETLNLISSDGGITSEFYASSLSAMRDLGHANDASTGKQPSAGTPAKAIYALQWADERSIVEESANQDLALKELAEALDAITRAEYGSNRMIRLVGADRAFMTEFELTEEDLAVDVDYTFLPGSMVARQKEAIKNELLQLKEAGLMDNATVMKAFPTAVPDAFRLSYNLQDAHARRMLDQMLKGDTVMALVPKPWEAPDIHAGVLQEFLLTRQADLVEPQRLAAITQTWQAYDALAKQAANPQAPAPAAPPPQGPPGGGAPLPEGAVAPEMQSMEPAMGAAAQEMQTETMAPPPNFGGQTNSQAMQG